VGGRVLLYQEGVTHNTGIHWVQELWDSEHWQWSMQVETSILQHLMAAAVCV
jgi:hypothetical protein